MPWLHFAEHLFLIAIVLFITRQSPPRRRRTATPKGSGGKLLKPKSPQDVRLSKKVLDAIPTITAAWLFQTMFRHE